MSLLVSSARSSLQAQPSSGHSSGCEGSLGRCHHVLRCKKSGEGDRSQGTLPPNPESARTTTTYKQLIMKTRCCFRWPASNISWQLGSLASVRRTASQCGRTVGAVLVPCGSGHLLIFTWPGLLMLSLVVLSLFNVSVLLAPIRFISALLELVPIPMSGRLTLLWATVINVAVSVGYERWMAQVVADAVGVFVSQQDGRRRIKDNRVY